DANGGQDEMVKFLNLLAEYIQKPSYNPPAGPVYNEQGQLRDRYTFYYGDDVTSDSTPRFLDSMNGDTIVGEDGLPVNKEEGWLVPNGQDIVPPSVDDEDKDEGGSTGGDSGNEGGDNDSDTEQEVVDKLPEGFEPVKGEDGLYGDGKGNYYQENEDGKYERVDENGDQLDENG